MAGMAETEIIFSWSTSISISVLLLLWNGFLHWMNTNSTEVLQAFIIRSGLQVLVVAGTAK
jgi:hypothetical protein